MPERLVSIVTAAILGALAVLHGIWAFAPWPLRSRARFADVVVGVDERDLPSTAATLGVSGLLALAARLVLQRGDVVEPVGREWVPRWGVRGLSAIFGLRAVAGFVLSGSGWRSTPAAFRRLDLAVYSPLCLALSGATAFLAVRGGPSPRAAAATTTPQLRTR